MIPLVEGACLLAVPSPLRAMPVPSAALTLPAPPTVQQLYDELREATWKSFIGMMYPLVI